MIDANEANDDVGGPEISNVQGDRRLLVFNRVYREGRRELWRLRGSKAVRIRSGRYATEVIDVDSGRILVREGPGRRYSRPTGPLAVLDSAGTVIRDFPLPGPSVLDAELTAQHLVVLRPNSIDVYDLRSGTRLRRGPIRTVPAGATLEDAEGNLAVYVAGVAIHLLRLTDGRDVVLDTRKATQPIRVLLEPDGLFYSYGEMRARKPWRLAFIPRQELNRALAKP